jgi:hypothetical protein
MQEERQATPAWSPLGGTQETLIRAPTDKGVYLTSGKEGIGPIIPTFRTKLFQFKKKTEPLIWGPYPPKHGSIQALRILRQQTNPPVFQLPYFRYFVWELNPQPYRV